MLIFFHVLKFYNLHKKNLMVTTLSSTFDPTQFEEAMSHVKWETQLKTNRTDYEVHLSALSTPVSFDLVQKVMRMEHTVAELSKMAIESGGEIGRGKEGREEGGKDRGREGEGGRDRGGRGREGGKDRGREREGGRDRGREEGTEGGGGEGGRGREGRTEGGREREGGWGEEGGKE